MNVRQEQCTVFLILQSISHISNNWIEPLLHVCFLISGFKGSEPSGSVLNRPFMLLLPWLHRLRKHMTLTHTEAMCVLIKGRPLDSL